jgi:hypothetical protein
MVRSSKEQKRFTENPEGDEVGGLQSRSHHNHRMSQNQGTLYFGGMAIVGYNGLSARVKSLCSGDISLTIQYFSPAI